MHWTRTRELDDKVRQLAEGMLPIAAFLTWWEAFTASADVRNDRAVRSLVEELATEIGAWQRGQLSDAGLHRRVGALLAARRSAW